MMHKYIHIKVRDEFIIGFALEKLEKFDEAIRMYDRAMKINPNDT